MALEDTALALIRKFGEDRQVSLLIPATAPADPAKPWEVDPTATETSITVPAVVVGAGGRGGASFKLGLGDGNSIQQGDEVILIAGLSLGSTIPATDSKILDEGQEKNIVAIDRIRPGKTDFLYKFLVRLS